MLYTNYMELNNIKKIFLIMLCVCWLHPVCAAVVSNPQNIAVYIPQNDDKTALMKKAFEQWQKKSNNNFVFKYVDDPELSDINVIFIEKNLSDYCGDIDALGCSNNRYLYNIITHSTIYIAKRRPKGLLLSNTQVYAIMRHEIGHALGLEHSKKFNDIMYPVTNLGISIRQDINDNDIKNLYQLYGINPHR